MENQWHEVGREDRIIKQIGAILIFIGFIISFHGLGFLVGVPLMIIGLILIIPEMFFAILIIGVIIDVGVLLWLLL